MTERRKKGRRETVIENRTTRDMKYKEKCEISRQFKEKIL